MKSRDLLVKLQDYTVFSAADIEKITGKNRQYVYLHMQRLKTAGLIFEIEKGKYSIQTDPFLVASRIVWPSYISGWAASQFYQLTEQLPNVIEVMTTRSRKNRQITFRGVGIEFSRLKKSNFFGYDKIRYKKHSIFIADKEKTLLDILFLGHISPSEFSEVVKSNHKRLSIRKLFSYARKMRFNLSKIRKLVKPDDQ
jgi:predicted transcriptional regulator of viral defense system